MDKFPENFDNLHAGEESVRVRTIEAVEQSDDLLLHLAVAERTADLIYHFIHRDTHKSDDDLAIRLLGIRIFNSLNATVKLLLSGYYQASTLQHRDLIETIFLLDYFQGDRTLIAQWRASDENALHSRFAPAKVRKALDARDGFTGKKRTEAYKTFSTLAGHPNPRGFDMLKLPNGKHLCGPFLEETALKATISELGKSAVQIGGIFTRFFTAQSKQDYQLKLAYAEIQQRWMRHFFEKEPVDSGSIEELRAMIARLDGSAKT